MRPNRYFLPTLILLTALLLPIAIRQATHAQTVPSAGNYIRVATWQDSAVDVPPVTWSRPAGLAVAPSGKVVVSDNRLRRVEVLDADGKSLAQFGRGTGPQDLVSPGHVAVDEARDHVYVADPGAARVAVYSMAGGPPLALWTGIAGPAGVAVAPDGRVVVTDVDGDRVRVFSPDGAPVTTWGSKGTGPAQYDVPAGVDVTPDGTVYVADRANKRLVATTLTGAPVELVRIDMAQLGGAEPLDLVANGDDDLWVAMSVGLARISVRSEELRGVLGEDAVAAVDSGTGGLYVAVSPADTDPGVWQYRYGQATGDPKATWGLPILAPGFFDGPETLSVGKDGKVYLLDVPPRIQRLGADGTAEQQTNSPDPVEVDADAAGNVYGVADDQVLAYGPDTTAKWTAKLHPVGLVGRDINVTGLAWDPAASVVGVLEATTERVYFIDPLGKEVGNWAPTSKEPARARWSDLTYGADGTMYLLDTGGSQVLGFAPVTRAKVMAVDLPEAGVRFDVAPDGTVLVLSASGWARRLGRDGKLLAAWDTTRLDRGGSSRPSDIAALPDGRVLVVDRGADVITVYGWDEEAPAGNPPNVIEGCELGADKTALPREIPLGETVDVALSVRGACAPSQSSADIVLLIDTSMDKGRFRAAQRSIESFLQEIDPATDQVAIQPLKRVDARGQTGTRLTNDVQLLRRVMRRLEPEYCEWDLTTSLEDAEGELFGVRGRPGAKKVLILLLGSDGIACRYCTDPQLRRQIYRVPGAMDKAAGQLKRRGVEVFGIWLYSRLLANPDCTAELIRLDGLQQLQDYATDREHVYEAPSKNAMASIYSRILSVIKPTVLLKTLAIVDEIPVNMAYVEGSSEPPASMVEEIGADGAPHRFLRWRLVNVPLVGAGVHYRLRPTEAGLWPTNVEASADGVDAKDALRHLTFPIPHVNVLAPTPTPTSTSTPVPTSTPTLTPSPTSTPLPTSTATLVPTATPTPEPQPVFLPLLLRESCEPSMRRADIVLVLDASTSMSEPTRGGRPKIDAAREAAGLFMDRLDFSHVQVAIVTFNSEAKLLQPLTRDRKALDAALTGITLQTLTRLDLGVATAHAELTSARRDPEASPGMIVLTDGKANPVPADVAVARAAEAKAAGVTVITIGLGDDLDFDALRAMASAPEDFHQAADGEDLAVIYQTLVGSLPCPVASFWGRR